MEAAAWLLKLAELCVAAAFHGEGGGEGGVEGGPSKAADSTPAKLGWLSRASDAFSAAHAHQYVCLGARHDATKRTAQWIQRMDTSKGVGR